MSTSIQPIKKMSPTSSVTKSCLLATALIFGTTPLQAGARGGIQAPVFSRFSSTSMNNLIAAVNEVKPADFELSICPFFGDSFDNITTFLAGVDSNVNTVLTCFLSFHTDKPGWNLATRSQALSNYLRSPAAKLGGATPLSKVKYLVLSWQLEDSVNDTDWKAQMKTVMNNMDVSVLRSGKISLRRSILEQGSGLQNTTFAYTRGNISYTFGVKVERHHLSPVPDAGSWSNDGDFVYDSTVRDGNTETANSAGDLIAGTLAKFTANAKNRIGATTLWRPAYGVWTRSVNSKTHVLTWTKSGNAWSRSDTNTIFDAREKAILKQFLKGL